MPKNGNETAFFAALKCVVGRDHLKAESLKKKVSKREVFLDKDYARYDFPQNITAMFEAILQDLLCTGLIPTGSLSHEIDGLLFEHPKLGTRIVEFDEEQHFSPFRYVTLQHLTSITDAKYVPHLRECCADLNCFRRMLKKNQLPADKGSTPAGLTDFVRFLERCGNPRSGYQKPIKPTFNYTGGRIAQRAYYDTLRDVAHYAKQNGKLKFPLRFSLFEFEKKSGHSFKKIDKNELCSLIKARLAELV